MGAENLDLHPFWIFEDECPWHAGREIGSEIELYPAAIEFHADVLQIDPWGSLKRDTHTPRRNAVLEHNGLKTGFRSEHGAGRSLIDDAQPDDARIVIELPRDIGC